MEVLAIDCTMRPGESRTEKMLDAFLKKYKKRHPMDTLTRRILRDEILIPLNPERLAERETLIEKEEWDHPMFAHAAEFSKADKIVVAAPFWDLSFPAILRIYFEQVFVRGLTFMYTKDGEAKGLCKAKKLAFITTCGGKLGSDDLASQYIKSASKMMGISKFIRISADKLDICQNPDARLKDAISDLKKAAASF